MGSRRRQYAPRTSRDLSRRELPRTTTASKDVLAGLTAAGLSGGVIGQAIIQYSTGWQAVRARSARQMAELG
jgi:hypothetical protein